MDDTGEKAFRRAVGRQLQYARKRVNKSLQAVADHVDVSRATVGHWETGRNPVDLGRLYSLARLYGTSVVALIAEELSNDDILALTRRQLEKPAKATLASASAPTPAPKPARPRKPRARRAA